MKRLIALTLAALLILCSAAAELPDISGLTFDELVALRDQLNLAIWQSSEWQEVTVPEGLWVVGEDIPAGHWTIRVATPDTICNAACMDKCDTITWTPLSGARYFGMLIASEDYESPFGDSYPTSVDMILEDGWFFKCTGSVIFAPFAGKPDLGFK